MICNVYGEAVHEEVARKGGFRMEHGGAKSLGLLVAKCLSRPSFLNSLGIEEHQKCSIPSLIGKIGIMEHKMRSIPSLIRKIGIEEY